MLIPQKVLNVAKMSKAKSYSIWYHLYKFLKMSDLSYSDWEIASDLDEPDSTLCTSRTRSTSRNV